MSQFFYDFFVRLYVSSIRLASLWNPKAKAWVKGRSKFPEFTSDRKRIWFHCASLGEFEQGRPVLEAIKEKFPHYDIVLSFFSPSGFEIRKNYPLADYVIYLPADTKKNAAKLIGSMKPELVIWVKYEYWFHYLSALKTSNIPVLLVSGIFRKTQPFFRWYGSFWKDILQCFQYIFVQDKHSADLLENIGINNVVVSGDTRFDRVLAIAEENKILPEIATFTQHNITIVAGSTWEADEQMLTAAVQQNKQLKLIIAPHEISTENLSRLKNQFQHAAFYSLWKNNPDMDCRVLVIDNIGMLSSLYKYATITYIGGGFNKSGIHNTLEAAVYGKPVIFGPNYSKFAEAVAMTENGAAFSVKNKEELMTIIDRLTNDEEVLQTSGIAAEKFVRSKAGATNIILNHATEKRLLIS